MPLINRCGGGGANLQTGITVEPAFETKIYTPDDGYDGFKDITVKNEKILFNYLTGTNYAKSSGQSYTVSNLCMYPYKNYPERMADILYSLVIFASDSSNCSEKELTVFSLAFKKNTAGNLLAYEKYLTRADGSGISVNPINETRFYGVTYDFDNNILTINFTDSQFNATDENSRKFSMNTRYSALAFYRDYPENYPG